MDGDLRAVTERFFDEEGWTYVAAPDAPELSFVFQGETGRWKCVVRMQEADEQWLFFSVSPVDAPPATRLAAMEYVTRANYGLTIGNFEMDLDDGEVRVKTSVDVQGSGLTTALVRRLVRANVWTMDTYLGGLVEVIEGRSSAAEAIAAVEG